MTVTVNFIRRGRVSHIRTFDIQNIDLFIKRLSSQFDDYELMVNEIDVADVESSHYDKYEHGRWYTYTGRMAYVRSPYGERWWNEYADEEGNIGLF